ncbi:MAG: 4Fe-4S dicluster domain-containing protein [Coriobacteriales bacterium]|nr:4Fe-4S dicluster domain-containing protein [Coriobacteriales bacterium]
MKVTIQKYDPAVDALPYTKDYDIPYTENMTALKAILDVHEKCEPIAFDYSCRGRVCGRCSVMVNGTAGTACTTAIPDKAVTIEPLRGFRIVKDLVVDKTEFHDRISALELRSRATEISYEDVLAPVDYDNVFMKLDPLEWCARCGSCQAMCPAVHDASSKDTYLGPAGMIAIGLRFFDPYDTGDRISQAVQEGLWNCIMCGMCDEVCPALEIEHIATWTKLREEATARNLTQKKAPLLPFG